MTIHHLEDAIHLFRVTVLSLEGVLLSSSLLSDDDGALALALVPSSPPMRASHNNNTYPYPVHNTIIVSAQTGFRTTFPPECVHVSCPQYSTLFPLHEGNLLTVKSQEREFVAQHQHQNHQHQAYYSGDNGAHRGINNWVEIVLHWRSGDEEEDNNNNNNNNNSNSIGGSLRSSSGSTNDISHQKEEGNNEQTMTPGTIAPHLEIMLPSPSIPPPATTPSHNRCTLSSKTDDECDDDSLHDLPSSPSPSMTLPDVIEFHVCVTVTPSTPDDDRMADCVNDRGSSARGLLDENDIIHNDSFFLDEEEEDTQQQQDHRIPPPTLPSSSSTTIHHYGIAHLKISPSELQQYNDEESTTSSSLLSYGRPGGKVVVLPIRKKEEVFTNHRSATDCFGDNDDTSNTEITRQQQQHEEQQQQHHHHHSETVKFSSDAALFVRVERVCVPNVHQSRKMEQQCHYIESTWENGSSSCAPASILHHDNNPTMPNNAPTTTTRRNDGILVSDHSQHMREESAPAKGRRSMGATIASAVADASTRRHEQITNNQYDNNYPPLRKSLSLQNIREKILCGASLPDLSETFKLVIEAGQHCDEDHGGLYVVNSNSFGGSTIATAD
jgi:hypothetical protein